ncbi:MAG: hypothetical protein IK005_08005 [Paludibacteraceae bacterium]|nr:hypothetical protein [Paludibacteraceae bacterium]
MKITAWSLSLLLAGSFVSCSNVSNNAGDTPTNDSASEIAQNIEETAAPENTAPAQITVEWTEKMNNDAMHNHDVILSENESAKFSLKTDKTVTDFKVLALQFVEADENGKVKFNQEERFKLESLSKEDIVNVRGEMFGTIPNIGISYKDGNELKTFAITESGKDGSLELMKIDQ